MSDEEKKVEDKIKKLADARTRESIEQLVPIVVSAINTMIEEPMTEREEIISGVIISSLLKQIMVIAVGMDQNALEKIAEEVFNEMGE